MTDTRGTSRWQREQWRREYEERHAVERRATIARFVAKAWRLGILGAREGMREWPRGVTR